MIACYAAETSGSFFVKRCEYWKTDEMVQKLLALVAQLTNNHTLLAWNRFILRIEHTAAPQKKYIELIINLQAWRAHTR